MNINSASNYLLWGSLKLVKEKAVCNVFENVDWDDPALKRWLDTITRKSTKHNYRSSYRAYAAFTNVTASALIDEAIEEAKRDPRERTEENNGRAFNPLGPHSFRESFGSIMINSGVPDTIVDFWLGHAIGERQKPTKHFSRKV